MLETLNDYMSFGVISLIVLAFIFFALKYTFNSIERYRIKRAMERENR